MLRRAVRELRLFARAIATSLYSRRLQYITVQPVAARGAASTSDTACVVVDSLEDLDAIAAAIPPGLRDSVEELRRRVAQGCVVTLALRRVDGARLEVVGYELAERGVFSAQGRRRRVSPDIVFSHWAEVLPAYRGQRIHALLFAARDAYFSRRGGRIVVGVVAPRNRASRQALERAGSAVVGKVQRVSLLSDAVVCQTSWERIDEALDGARRRARGIPLPSVSFTWSRVALVVGLVGVAMSTVEAHRAAHPLPAPHRAAPAPPAGTPAAVPPKVEIAGTTAPRRVFSALGVDTRRQRNPTREVPPPVSRK